jgi:hypothetical protein
MDAAMDAAMNDIDNIDNIDVKIGNIDNVDNFNVYDKSYDIVDTGIFYSNYIDCKNKLIKAIDCGIVKNIRPVLNFYTESSYIYPGKRNVKHESATGADYWYSSIDPDYYQKRDGLSHPRWESTQYHLREVLSFGSVCEKCKICVDFDTFTKVERIRQNQCKKEGSHYYRISNKPNYNCY